MGPAGSDRVLSFSRAFPLPLLVDPLGGMEWVGILSMHGEGGRVENVAKLFPGQQNIGSLSLSQSQRCPSHQRSHGGSAEALAATPAHPPQSLPAALIGPDECFWQCSVI